MVRTGIGFDVHKLVEGRKLILGGIEIDHVKGLLGHSDADVICHAISDALLGAAGLGDIGMMFPDTDPANKDISSLKILSAIAEKLKLEGYSIINIDVVTIAQEPKIAPYIKQMKQTIAKILLIEQEFVSIKGKTTEFLGFTGRREGIAAIAVAAINKQ